MRTLLDIQRNIVTMIACGLDTMAIAEKLDMTPDGVKYHIAEIKYKLDAHNRPHIVARALLLEEVYMYEFIEFEKNL